jgi:hypothetical protein
VDAFSRIAEDRIRRALEEGAFDGLVNSGRPLDLQADAWVPEDLRMAYRVLKNAGCIPPELELRKDILNLRLLLETAGDEEERIRRLRELNYKIMSLNLMRERPLDLQEYEDRAFERLMGERPPAP